MPTLWGHSGLRLPHHVTVPRLPSVACGEDVMITVGSPPYLECSSRGDRRFSAFHARPTFLQGSSIEEAYQAVKIFEDGSTGLHWKQAKGKRAINQEFCAEAYELWWRMWVIEQNLLPILKSASGLSDIFGQPGHVCQATVLWKIRNAAL